MAMRHWDVFCEVVDNYGDIGVCWRLAGGLARRGQRVRLFVDDASALHWMAPQGQEGVQVVPLAAPGQPPPGYEPGDVVIAAFGCPLAPALQAALLAPSRRPAPVWIHLEYLSAEAYVARSHGLESPLPGAAVGVHRWFYFPGFTPDTGGLLREEGLAARRQAFDRSAWLRAHAPSWAGEPVTSLFCYEPALLADWLLALASAPARLLVTAGRAAAAVRAALQGLPPGWNGAGHLAIDELPWLDQDDYDRLLWASDLNFVRGEDSLVRALWAGAAFVWQAYPQDDAAHGAKVEALLAWLEAPPSLRDFTRAWNGLAPGPLPPACPAAWRDCVRAAQGRLLAQDDLVSRLLRFVAQKG